MKTRVGLALLTSGLVATSAALAHDTSGYYSVTTVTSDPTYTAVYIDLDHACSATDHQHRYRIANSNEAMVKVAWLRSWPGRR